MCGHWMLESPKMVQIVVQEHQNRTCQVCARGPLEKQPPKNGWGEHPRHAMQENHGAGNRE